MTREEAFNLIWCHYQATFGSMYQIKRDSLRQQNIDHSKSADELTMNALNAGAAALFSLIECVELIDPVRGLNFRYNYGNVN